MKAMILAAGLGERMRPLTESRAKPSLTLLNRPMIVHTLHYLKRFGVTEVVINLHHQPESIRGVVGGGSRLGLKVHYSDEPVILGTAGGLKKAEAILRDGGSFALINSDFITDCDLGLALKKHRETAALATMVLTPIRAGVDYGVVETDDKDRVVRIAGKPPGDPDPHLGRYHFTGIHLLEPAIFDAIPAGRNVEINSEVYPGLITAGKPIRAFVHSGLWRELGTPQLYIDGSITLLKEGKDPLLQPLQTQPGIYLDRVVLPPETLLEPPALLGRGTTVGPKCSLQGAIVGKQARLGKGCSLRSTVVWDGARIGDGAELSECIVTSGVYVPPEVTLSNKIIFRVEGYQGKKDRLERLGSCWMAGF
jgi:NDP-sugar pyrophosphorylase family protein